MTWVTTEMRSAVHVHPFYEDGHVLGFDCWCEPTVPLDHPDDALPMVIHNDRLGREGPFDPDRERGLS